VRAVTLTAIPTHLVADINFGRYDTNSAGKEKARSPWEGGLLPTKNCFSQN